MGDRTPSGPTKPFDLAERTFNFSVRIIRLCQTLLKSGGIGRTISRQVLRSGTSIGANVQEAIGAQSRADFIHKHSIARKEARETLYWLRLLSASGLVREEMIVDIRAECDELVAILTALIKKAEANQRKAKG